MAVRGRAAAAAMAAAAERRLPSLDDFAGQSWSAWVERAGPPAEPGSEQEESGKSGSKKLDAMTLIKEDMSIFGHCPAHDEFYLVVCNHCSQVVKPQAFQKHCERRHGPLSKLYARAGSGPPKCPAVNGQPPACGVPGATKAPREKVPGARGRAQPLPDKAQKDNLCLFVPVVNLEKISSLPKADGQGIKVPPKPPAGPGQPACGSKEPPAKPSLAAAPKEPAAKAGGDSLAPAAGPARRPESAPAPGEQEPAASKPPPKSHKKTARKECDLNRQCGVLNPETKKICTRLLTCKIHSVHQRREVRGRAKDFDVLVAELKASSRRGECPKEKSPPRKEPPPERLCQDAASPPQPPAGLPGAPPCRAKPPPTHPPPRSRLSSASDAEEPPAAASGEGDAGLYPFALPKGGSRGSSDESEEEAEDARRPDCQYASRPPRPQAFCTFGSRLLSPGCYVFNRRLDRFCSALGSMLERHLSSHMWKKIPPAADPQLPAAPPGLRGGVTARGGRLQPARVPRRRQPVHHVAAARQHPLALLQQVAFHQGQQILQSQGARRRRPQAQAAPGGRRRPPLQTDLPGGHGQGQSPRLPGLPPARQDETLAGLPVVVVVVLPQRFGGSGLPGETGRLAGLQGRWPPSSSSSSAAGAAGEGLAAGKPRLAAPRAQGAGGELPRRGQEAQERRHVLPARQAQAPRPPAGPRRLGLLRAQEEAGGPAGLRGEAQRPEVESTLTEEPAAGPRPRPPRRPRSRRFPFYNFLSFFLKRAQKAARQTRHHAKADTRKKGKNSVKIPQDSYFSCSVAATRAPPPGEEPQPAREPGPGAGSTPRARAGGGGLAAGGSRGAGLGYL